MIGHSPYVQYAIDLQFQLKDCSGINKRREGVFYFFKDGTLDGFVVAVSYKEIQECMENQTIPTKLKQYLK